jgi:hypothetical protein
MARFRHIAVWGLLATLVVGGVAGPVVHRMHHAAERLAKADEPCHPAAVHNTDVPVWTADADLEVPACDLCATRLLVVPPKLAPLSSPRTVGTTRVVLRTHLAPVHVRADRTIRGPPLVSAARSA